MQELNRRLLQGNFTFAGDIEVARLPENLPERILQFGEGNFLRAFVDWMVHQLNKAGKFNGQVVVVQPIAEGLADQLNRQDGLYTLLLRGLRDGSPAEQKELVSSVGRAINPYSDWQAFIQCAENPEIEYIVSNTTEAGITYEHGDRPDMQPPASFPAKLTVYLRHRFQYFNGDPGKGIVIIPCELIDRNGDCLKEIVLKLAEAWKLPQKFIEWVDKHNYFLNTLVDRVVTGYPRDEISALTATLGYSDALIDSGELFHLWVIEGPKELALRLPFDQIGLNVVWTEDMTPYRTRKVRILNGAHTASIPAAFLYGLETVGEMMDHAVLGKYVRQVVYDEIIPSIDLDTAMLTEFADSVIERFRNPYIKHYLLSILLNSSSKFKTRVLPSILEYQQIHGRLPEKLTFSLAALLAVYKDGIVDGSVMKAERIKGPFEMRDDLPVLEFFAGIWREYHQGMADVGLIAKKALGHTPLWGRDLNEINGLTDKVAGYLREITAEGMQAAVLRLTGGK